MRTGSASDRGLLETWFGRKATIVSVLLILLVLAGAALGSLQFGPARAVGAAVFSVSIEYFGVDAEEMERQVTIPLEDAIAALSGMQSEEIIDRNATSLPKAVVEAAFALAQVNDVSDPVQTESGYAIVVLTQKQPGFSKSLAESKADIQSRLTYEGRQQKRNTLIADVRKRTKIEIDEAQLAKLTLPLPGSGQSTAAPDKRSPGPGAPPPAPATPGH